MRKELARSIVLGLLVTTVGYSGMAKAATPEFTAGPYTGVSGKYESSQTQIVNPTADINITANGDTEFTTTGQSAIILGGTYTTDIDMKGNNLTLTANNAVTLNGQASSKMNITNAKDFTFNCNSSGGVFNDLELGGSSVVDIQANNMSFKQTGTNVTTNHAFITSESNSKINLQAKQDIVIWSPYISLIGSNDSDVILEAGGSISITSTQGNTLQAKGNLMTLKAGKDIYLESDDTASNFSATKPLNLIADTGTITLYGGTGNTQAVLAYNSAQVVFQAAGDISIAGTQARGVTARGTSTTDFTSKNGIISITAIQTNHPNSTNAGIYTQDTAAVKLHSDAVINAAEKGIDANGGTVTANKALTMTAAPIAVEASGSARVTAMDAASAKQVAGNMTADGAGTSVDMNFATADSYFTGSTKVTNSGAINLAFANNAPWNVTADSTLTQLDNNGVVNMRYTGTGNYETVTTDTLSGAGTLKVNTDLQASKDNLDVTTNSDKLVITGISSGTYTIDVEDTSLLSGKQSEGYVLLVEDKTSGGATFVGGDVAKGGLYKYTPLILSVNPGDNPDILDTYSNVPTGNVKNWYLAGYEKSGELQPVVAPLVGAGENRYAAYRFEQDNLLLRLGELRDNENSQGIWAKVKSAKETVNDTTDSRFTMYQVGYDKKYKDDENGRKYFGVAVNHTKGDQDYSSTSHGESSSNAMTLYNTWLGNKGHYLDLVGKVGKINTDWDYSNARFPDRGDSKAWFYSLSGEYGRKIMNKDGFYTEPQAQLTYGHINGAGYTSDSGINVDQDSINSLIGRVGFTIGKHFNGDEDGKRTNVYAKLFYNHEFLGDSDVRMNDTYGDSYSHSGDFGGSWWTAGVGVTAQLDKKTNAYVDVQKTFGGDIDQKWQFNIGLRWNWGGAKK